MSTTTKTKPKAVAKPITRTALRKLINQLPESELVAAHRYLCYLRDEGDPLLSKLRNAPTEDEELSHEGWSAIQEGLDDIREGRIVSRDSVWNEPP